MVTLCCSIQKEYRLAFQSLSRIRWWFSPGAVTLSFISQLSWPLAAFSVSGTGSAGLDLLPHRERWSKHWVESMSSFMRCPSPAHGRLGMTEARDAQLRFANAAAPNAVLVSTESRPPLWLTLNRLGMHILGYDARRSLRPAAPSASRRGESPAAAACRQVSAGPELNEGI